MAEDPGNPDGRINTETKGRLLLIGIDRPHKLNAFTPKMYRELGDAYTRLEEDDELWCGVVHPVGANTTAGLDLPKMQPLLDSGADWFGEGNIDALGLQGPFRSKPVVMAVRGISYTLAVELMLACDIVVAGDDCRFTQFEVKRNLMATGGATLRMVIRAGWGNAMRYLLTDDEFDAATALRLNYVQEVVPADQVLDRAVEIALNICAQSPLAVRATIANARKYLQEGYGPAVAEFDHVNVNLRRSKDAEEALAAFIEKRPPRFTGQ